MIHTDSCSADAVELLSVDNAIAKIHAQLQIINANETVALAQALGRVLALDVYSAINLPYERNAAMDGYAFASTDAVSGHEFGLNIAGTSWAGRPFCQPLQAGQCVRIFTGAVVPAAADSVVMQEAVTVVGEKVVFPAACRVRQNIREAGEEIKQHELLLAAPKVLTAADLGLLASAGVANVSVTRKLEIGFFSTGDELVSLEQPLTSGQIYDSNRYLLQGLLTDPCVNLHNLGTITDDEALLEQHLKTAATSLDVIISTGGASIGAADYMAAILKRCGKINFWKVAMKPGKPLLFGHLNNCVFFGLPGNPVAVMITFDKFVKPALQQLCGYPRLKPLQIQAISTSNLKKTAGRQEYQRGILHQHTNGQFSVQSVGKQGSHLLSSLSHANCYIVLSQDCEGVNIGDWVTVEPFAAFI